MGSFSLIDKDPSYLKVFKSVESLIFSREIEEGSALPTEAALCEQMGVNRTTVREGLRMLEQADLVERGAAKRFYVKRPDANDIATATSKRLALGGATFRETWEALHAFYPAAAGLAATQIKPENIAALRTVIDAHRKETASQKTVVHAVNFFNTLALSLDNRVMLAYMQSLNLLIHASLATVINKTPNAQTRIIKAQVKIIDAIESGNTAEATHWMSKHIDDLKRGYVLAKIDLDREIR